MSDLNADGIRDIFRSSDDFNELFEAFRSAIEKGISDLEAYRELFWNQTLTPEELMFFAKKLGETFPSIGYETYMWLSNIFNTRFDSEDTLELAFLCLKKAAEFDPGAPEPYLNACELYDEDLRIPTIQSIIAFLRTGAEKSGSPKQIFGRLATLYAVIGNDEMARYFGDKAV